MKERGNGKEKEKKKKEHTHTDGGSTREQIVERKKVGERDRG